MLDFLEQSQWWPTERMRSWQWDRLARLVEHAWRTVPIQRSRLAEAGYRPGDELTADLWSRVPILKRADVQAAGAALQSADPPTDHGATSDVSTSGSTGTPVTVSRTALANLWWHAITVRDHQWQRRDLSLGLCAIRDTKSLGCDGRPDLASYPAGRSFPDWGGAAAALGPTGPAAGLSIHTPVEHQLDWLRRQAPGYVVTYPSNVRALSEHCRETGEEPPAVAGIGTVGEVVTPKLRRLVANCWGVRLADVYSAAEIGYMALQCPDHDHYHAQAEAALVEVVDDDGSPCRAAEAGRVVVTPLQNFATPLLRYAVGDDARLGEPCRCGRGLPVLTEVLGRTRNMMTLPDGHRIWPNLEGAAFADVAPVRQFQVIQDTTESLTVRLVVARPLTDREEDSLRYLIQGRLGADSSISFSYHDVIERAASGKYEDFRSALRSDA